MSIPSKELMTTKAEKSRDNFLGFIKDQISEEGSNYEFDYESSRQVLVLYNRLLGDAMNLKLHYKEKLDFELCSELYNNIFSHGHYKPLEEPKIIKLDI